MKIVVTGTRGIPNIMEAWRHTARNCFRGWQKEIMAYKK